MSTNITEHWDEIKEVKQKLAGHVGEDGELYIVSRNRKKQGILEGRVSVATLDQAALHIAAETHELASPEQIDAWKKEQAERKRAIERAAAQKESRLDPNLETLANLFLAQAQKSAPAPKAGGKSAVAE